MKTRSLTMFGLFGLVCCIAVGCGSTVEDQTAVSAAASGGENTSSSGMGGSGGSEVVCPDGSFVAFDIVEPLVNPSYPSGTLGADIMEMAVSNCANEPLTLKGIQVQVMVDCDTDGTFSASGNADIMGFCPTESNGSSPQDILYGLAVFSGAQQVSDFKAIQSNGLLNLNFTGNDLKPQSVTRIVFRGNVNNSAPNGTSSDRIKFALLDALIITINGDLLTTSNISMSGATNGGTNDSGVIVTITK